MNAPEKIVIVGLGLIGGSIAKALKLFGRHRILGMDANEETLLDAMSCGAIDDKAGASDLFEADLVYLCVYPDAAMKFMKELAPKLKKDCILTDTCGIKGEICSFYEGIRGTGSYIFVAGHPMAGKETNGFGASDASLFVGASYLIAPCGAPDWAVDAVAGLAKEMGFGRIVMTTPGQHDRVIAYTSQLPHVLACSYVMSPRCLEHKGFSAGSYRDVSRVANINAELWTGLFLDNRQALTEEIDELIRNLTLYRNAVSQGDEDGLFRLLSRAAGIKREQG